MKKIFNCIGKIFDVSWDYYFITFVVILGLALVGEENKGTQFGIVLNYIVGTLFLIWLVVVIIKLVKRVFKISVMWPLVTCLVLVIISFILSYVNKNGIANILFVISLVFLEVHLIYYIILNTYSQKAKISNIIFASLLFISLGLWIIYNTTYNIEDNRTLFNALIILFSSIVGGGLTLGGVAWTIKNGQRERKEDEIKKARPIVFVRNPKNVSEETLDVKMFSNKCFGSLKKAKGKGYCIKYLYIHNADHSYVSIRGFRINDDYHIYDVGQVLTKNTTFRLSSEFVFSYKDEIKYVALIIEDMLENLYEYTVNFELDKQSVYGIKIAIISGIELKPTTLPINAKDI